jgi:hypothetical protein
MNDDEVEVGPARWQRVDQRAPIPAFLVDLDQPDQHRPVRPDQHRVDCRERVEPVERHRERRAPAKAPVARYAYRGATLGGAKRARAVGHEHVSVEVVHRPEVGEHLGALPRRVEPLVDTVGRAGAIPGAPVVLRAHCDDPARPAPADIVVADRIGVLVVGLHRREVLQQFAAAHVPEAAGVRPAAELVLVPVDHRVVGREPARRGVGADHA